MTEQEMRTKVIKGLECHKRAMYGEIDEHGIACNSCPYKDMESSCHSRTEGRLITDAIALLKAQENEIKALRLLIDWAEECDFGLDNIRWREYVTKEELDRVEDYIEKMIYVARKAVEQVDGQDGEGCQWVGVLCGNEW